MRAILPRFKSGSTPHFLFDRMHDWASVEKASASFAQKRKLDATKHSRLLCECKCASQFFKRLNIEPLESCQAPRQGERREC